MTCDVAVAGAGPAGAACAAFSAAAGLRTVLLERATFPREKVCGDCLNPACWAVLERLQLADRVLALAHSRLEEVEFINIRGRSLCYPLAPSARGEIAVKRSLFDHLLLQRARELGAEVQEGVTVERVEPGWKVTTSSGVIRARRLVAADGRNSTVARALGLLRSPQRDRVGVQTHVLAPAGFGNRVVMRFLPQGYGGIASVGGGQLNVCLVSSGERLGELKEWAAREFQLATSPEWRTIAPLSRAPAPATHRGLLLAGDAARVVEPFTGEGIYYALASGELAARHLIADMLPEYARAHAGLYRGRLWVNQLARQAALYPRLASLALELARFHPAGLRFLTAKVVGAALPRAGVPGESKETAPG